MKSERMERIVCIICLTVLILFMCSIGLRFITRQVLVERFGMDNALTRLIFFDKLTLQTNEEEEDRTTIDWEALYPFSAEAQDIRVIKGQSASERFSDAVFSIEEKIEAYASDHLIGYSALVETAKLYESVLQWGITSYNEYNGIIELNDGYLTTISNRCYFTDRIAASVSAFAEYCGSKGADFLYLQAPYKVCKVSDAYVADNVDFSNQNADDLLKLLRDNDVDTYDFRETLHDENLSHHELFYRTDHHWKAETGLWAARHILQYLHDEYAYDVDASVLDANRFTSVEYPNWFLGSQGKKVTLVRTTPDDFCLLYPSYETELHYEVPDLNIDITGDFSVIYDMSHVDELDYYQQNPLGAYCYGDLPLQKLENKLLTNEMKLLIIGDSFDNSVIPFLSLGVQYVESLDLRHFKGSVQSYIESSQPDIILVMYNPGVIFSEDLFDFR